MPMIRNRIAWCEMLTEESWFLIVYLLRLDYSRRERLVNGSLAFCVHLLQIKPNPVFGVITIVPALATSTAALMVLFLWSDLFMAY